MAVLSKNNLSERFCKMSLGYRMLLDSRWQRRGALTIHAATSTSGLFVYGTVTSRCALLHV